MLHRSLRIALWAMSVAAVLAFLGVAVMRAVQLPTDPDEQRWLAGAARLAAGQPLYGTGEPTGMPGLPAIASVVVALFGDTRWAVTLPALLALLGAGWLAVAMVKVETASATLAAASAGMFLGGLLLEPGLVGHGSEHAVMLALALSGYAVLRMARGAGGALLGALLLCAAAFVHPFALCWIVAVTLHLLIEDRRRALVFVLAVAAIGGGGYVLLLRQLGPAFTDAAAQAALPGLAFHPARALRLVGDELLGRYGVLTLVVVLSVALPVRPWRGAGGIWMWMAFAAAASAVLATQTTTPEPVALLPTVLALAIVGPVAVQRVARHLSAWPGSTRLAGQGVVLVALVLQFTALIARLPSVLMELSRAG